MNNKNITVKHLCSNIIEFAKLLKEEYQTTDPDPTYALAVIHTIEAQCTALRDQIVPNEGDNAEVFDGLADEGRITKYIGSVRVPTGSTSGVNLTNDTDGDCIPFDGGDQEVFDEIGHKDIRPEACDGTVLVRVPAGNGVGVKLTGNQWADLAEKVSPGKKSGFWK